MSGKCVLQVAPKEVFNIQLWKTGSLTSVAEILQVL